MGCLRKYLQRVGLVPTMLIVGILGGLMAPLPSEAVPTVTVKVDSGTASSILNTTSSICTTTELSLGYTACYAINTNLTVAGVPPQGTTLPVRSYNVRNAPGATARLRVADNLGNDKLSLVGVQFIPTVLNWGNTAPTFANTNEQHVLTITVSNPFDSIVNTANIGNYVWAIRAGGEFRAGPSPTTAPTACAGTTTTGSCNTIGNAVTYPGQGTFSPNLVNRAILSPAGSTANTKPLSLTVAGPTSAIVSFDGLTNATMGQSNPTYPTFICDDNGGTAGGTCKPSITQTMTVTLKGPDTFVLVNGQDTFGANCTTTLSAKQQKQITFLTKLVTFLNWWESYHPNPRLSAFIDKIEAFLAVVNSNPDPDCPGATLVNLDIATAAALDQVAFAASGALPVEPAPQGTITINKHLDLSCDGPCSGLVPEPFTFSIRNTSDNSIVTETNVTTDGAGHGQTVVSVPDGIYNVVESPKLGWNLTQASCGGGNTNGITVLAGGNVTCSFTNSPATSNDLGIRLTWGAAPSDLDSHLYVPNGYHVFYPTANQGSLEVSPYADLDLDDVTGFGPENITVVRRMKGTYQYFVHNYSDRLDTVIMNPMTNSPAKVELIRNGTTTTYFPPSSEGTNRYWHVFNVTVDSDTCAVTITPINQWLASPPAPVTQAEVLCVP